MILCSRQNMGRTRMYANKTFSVFYSRTTVKEWKSYLFVTKLETIIDVHVVDVDATSYLNTDSPTMVLQRFLLPVLPSAGPLFLLSCRSCDGLLGGEARHFVTKLAHQLSMEQPTSVVTNSIRVRLGLGASFAPSTIASVVPGFALPISVIPFISTFDYHTVGIFF
jgi:hypothetical protein